VKAEIDYKELDNNKKKLKPKNGMNEKVRKVLNMDDYRCLIIRCSSEQGADHVHKLHKIHFNKEYKIRWNKV